MSTSTLQPTVRVAFEGLIDYAGLFPPAKLDMAQALGEYDDCRRGDYAWMLGKFIVPASRMPELLERMSAERLPLSVIVDAGNDPRSWFGNANAVLERIAAYRLKEARVSIDALEVPLPRLVSKRDTYEATIGQCAMLAEKHGLRDLPAYVEIPRDERFEELLSNTAQALRRYDLHGKVRCGGLTPDAYPSPQELARYIWTDREYAGGFKATAGLHHPVRHYNAAAGATMHGFLNLLFATALADRLEVAELAKILDDTEAAHFVFNDRDVRYMAEEISLDDLEAARAHFMAYGSCSFSEPVDDLIALSILPKA
jgi:hypothetical protein